MGGSLPALLSALNNEVTRLTGKIPLKPSKKSRSLPTFNLYSSPVRALDIQIVIERNQSAKVCILFPARFADKPSPFLRIESSHFSACRTTLRTAAALGSPTFRLCQTTCRGTTILRAWRRTFSPIHHNWSCSWCSWWCPETWKTALTSTWPCSVCWPL